MIYSALSRLSSKEYFSGSLDQEESLEITSEKAARAPFRYLALLAPSIVGLVEGEQAALEGPEALQVREPRVDSLVLR